MYETNLKLLIFLISLILINFPVYSEQNWKIVDKINKADETKTFFLISNKVLSFPEIEGPLKKTYSSIMFKCDAMKNISSFFGFTNKPNIKNSETEGMFNVVSTVIKFDDVVYDLKLYNPRTWRSNFFLTKSNSLFVKKIINTKNVSLEINWVNQGTKYFKYDTSGFLDIYKDFKNICGI
jgi:hypothetical protein